MSSEPLEIGFVGDGVASLQIATDENPYLGKWFVPVLAKAVQNLSIDERIRAVIFEGGKRYFSAGASTDALLTTDRDSLVTNYEADISRLVLSVPVPTIAAMAGHAIGGGLILGFWCDVPILAEESMYGASFMALGFTPGMGSTAVMPEVLGAPLARELLYTGRLMKGRELKAAAGLLAHAIVPRSQVRQRAIALAEEIAQVPRQALVLLKQSLSARRRKILEDAVIEELGMQTELFALEETRLQIAERYPAPLSNSRAKDNAA